MTCSNRLNPRPFSLFLPNHLPLSLFVHRLHIELLIPRSSSARSQNRAYQAVQYDINQQNAFNGFEFHVAFFASCFADSIALFHL